MNRHETYKDHEYIVYYDETSDRSPIKLVALGSKKATTIEYPMIKKVICTYPEACAEVRRMNLEYIVARKKGRPKNG